MAIAVTAEADAADLSSGDVVGDENTAIALDFSAALVDTDGSETMGAVVISGLPEGSELSAGVLDVDSGNWLVAADDLTGLSLTPPVDFFGELSLTAQVTTTEATGDIATATTSSTVVIEKVYDNIITGGRRGDRLNGTKDDDAIFGGRGRDNIDGGKGDDLVSGGQGNDNLKGGDGNDIVLGGTGRDRLDGGKGDDVLDGGEGNDNIKAGDGNDQVFGGTGRDRIDGGKGDDIIDGGRDNDDIKGGDGNDTILGGHGNDKIDGGKGDDILDGGAGNDIIKGDKGNDQFVFGAGSGNDDIDGGKSAIYSDEVRLNDVTAGPGGEASGYGEWTLQTNDDYTVQDGHISFDFGDASGTITLWDGSELEFSNIEDIIF